MNWRWVKVAGSSLLGFVTVAGATLAEHMNWGWVKVAGSSLLGFVTVAGATLAEQCGSDSACYEQQWAGALIVAGLAALGIGRAHVALSPTRQPPPSTTP